MNIMQIRDEIIITGRRNKIIAFLRLLRETQTKMYKSNKSHVISDLIRTISSSLNTELNATRTIRANDKRQLVLRKRIYGLTCNFSIIMNDVIPYNNEHIGCEVILTEHKKTKAIKTNVIYIVSDSMVNEWCLNSVSVKDKSPENEGIVHTIINKIHDVYSRTVAHK